MQLLADEKYLTETVHKVVLPPARDIQFFKTMLLVHAEPLLFQPAASDTAAATAKASYHHSGTKVSPECENSYPLRDQLPITNSRVETDLPLRQNACNFWPLQNVRLDLWKK